MARLVCALCLALAAATSAHAGRLMRQQLDCRALLRRKPDCQARLFNKDGVEHRATET